MWDTFRNSGLIAFPISLFGVIALGLGIASAASKSALGRTLGLATFALVGFIGALGCFGAVHSRSIVNAAISGESIDASQKERIRHEGYIEAQGPAKMGLFFAVVPLALAAFAVWGKRRADDAKEPDPEVAVGPLVAVAIATLFGVGEGVLIAQPIPGRDWSVMDPRWAVVSAVAKVDKAGLGDLVTDCNALDKAVNGAGKAGLELAQPDAQKCTDARITDALHQHPAAAVRGSLTALSASPLLDAAGKARVAAEIAKLPPGP